MRKSAVQISLWDIYNGVSEAIEQHKPQLIRLLEEHIDFDRLIPASFKLAFYRHMGRKYIYHLESFILQMAAFSGQQGRNTRPVRAIIGGQQAA